MKLWLAGSYNRGIVARFGSIFLVLLAVFTAFAPVICQRGYYGEVMLVSGRPLVSGSYQFANLTRQCPDFGYRFTSSN